MRMGKLAAVVTCVLSACGGGTNGDDGPPTDGPPVTPPEKTCGAPVTAVDTTTPDHVIGDGTATSCTQETVAAAVAMGGKIAFNCGTATIAITATLDLRTDVDTVLDGGGKVTLDGGDAVRILSFDHQDYRKNTVTLTLQHIKLAHGRAKGTKMYAPVSNQPKCSQGYYDGAGGALNMRDGKLVVIDSQFEENRGESLGPDVGGGAIAILGSLGAVVADSTFSGNKASNGGAMYALNSELDVYDTTFEGNEAQGHGANSDDSSMCSVVADTGQHQVGSGGNAGAIGIDGGDDLTHTFCGVHFNHNKSGEEALGGAIGRTPDRAKQTTVIDRCTFDGNTGYSAGAVYFHNSKLVITATSFINNVASHGSGAVQADGTDFDFLNDTFANNSAMLGLGGAIDLFGGGGKIAFTTFFANHADGGDPYFGAAIGGNPTLTLESDIFANQTAQNPGAPMTCQVSATGDGNVQWPMNHVVGGGADAKCTPTTTFADPMLGALGDNGGATPTLVPMAGGPAAGIGVNCPPTDQRGNTRPATGCTAGAVQL
ncbi:MAG TPA: choice-of-anchor Q domain-containing protein [Kofleriaceae bacterium]